MPRADAPKKPIDRDRTPAWRSRSAWFVFTLSIVLALGADLASKSVAFSRIADRPVTIERSDVLNAGPGQLQALIPAHEPVVFIPHLLEFKLVLNKGAVFGMGQGRRMLFIGFTFVALGFAVVLFARWTRAGDWGAGGPSGETKE